MDVIYEWILYVILSFVGIIGLHLLVPNPVIFAFVLSIIIGFISVKDSK